jgi:hypothetical protein
MERIKVPHTVDRIFLIGLISFSMLSVFSRLGLIQSEGRIHIAKAAIARQHTNRMMVFIGITRILFSFRPDYWRSEQNQNA